MPSVGTPSVRRIATRFLPVVFAGMYFVLLVKASMPQLVWVVLHKYWFLIILLIKLFFAVFWAVVAREPASAIEVAVQVLGYSSEA